jgi:hypothetical protein
MAFSSGARIGEKVLNHDHPQGPSRRTPGAVPSSQYRLYFRSDRDGHITTSHEFEAEDDRHAIKIAEAWLEGRRAELWTGSRKIKSWEIRPNRND